MTVVQGQSGCAGVLVESRPGRGECDRGAECEVLALLPDYIAYRNAHHRIVAKDDDDASRA
jgi:hypothetical protein